MVSRWLREEGIYSCWAARKPLLTTAHIEKRLEFVKAHMGFNFAKVVFSDEKIWRMRPCGQRVRVWRRRGDRYEARYCTKSTVKSMGVMVWCAINGNGDIIWKRCPDKVDAKAYQDILKSSLHFIRPRCTTFKCF